MIIITGSAEIPEENREEAFRLGCEHSARSRGEPGCLAHNCYQDLESPGRMHFFEQWESVEAVRTHFAVPESGNFIRQVMALASAPPEIAIYSAEAVDLPAA
ncbi:putative quinol monooxygenase [Qipengyuania vesicularis]|uniref:putative quinol monooxygenase n=1 Tax=Qipengyuania vesicularis TaxID=2867232 RepID=UPI001C86A7BB|nr:antibiotic biosynthesis monooxygenase [Qipengyuania vesicularis]MBX7526771.1 antibiotic biosynthesis monooxygenase [Qipengyuania vesicularis]